MNHVVVDQERCLHDGLCISACPVSALERLTTLDGEVPTSSHGERCIRCGHCVSVCRADALALTFLPRRDLRPIAPRTRSVPNRPSSCCRRGVRFVAIGTIWFRAISSRVRWTAPASRPRGSISSRWPGRC